MSSTDVDEKVLTLLGTIEKQTDRWNYHYIHYLFGALIPAAELEKASTFCDLYKCLRQSEEHFATALSITGYVVGRLQTTEHIEELKGIINDTEGFDTTLEIECLCFRELLANVAVELKEEDAEEFISEFSRLEIHESPDRFRYPKDDPVSYLFAMFTRAEQKEVLQSSDSEQFTLKKHLKGLGREDIIRKYLQPYNSKPFLFRVHSILSRLKSPGTNALLPPPTELHPTEQYQGLVRAAYCAAPEIPPDQWPPITKAHYVNLALITPDHMPRSHLFSRETVRGSADDIMKLKEPIKYEEMLANHTGSKRVLTLIEGRPGAGKTTLITKVSKDWADSRILPNVDLLVLAPLRSFAKPDLSLVDLLGLYCHSSAVVEALCKEIETNGGKGVCIALDGLDEYNMKLMKRGNFIYDLIYGYKLPNASVIVTSRPAGAHELRRHAKLSQYHIEIIGFLEEEIKAFVEHYYDEDPVKAQKLLDFLNSHPNIKRMCYLPLHLAMVTFLHDVDVELPNTETEMYMTFTMQTLLRAWKKELSADEAYDLEFHEIEDLPEEKMRIFNHVCQLALAATCDQKPILTGKEIKAKNILPIVPGRVEFNSLGLLTIDREFAKRAIETKTFTFLHLTLQEFLTAFFIITQLTLGEQLELIRKYGGAVHMRVVWKFYCGLANQKTIDEMKRMDEQAFLASFDQIASQNLGDRLAVLNMMRCAFESQLSDTSIHLLAQLKGIVDVNDITLNPSDCSTLGYVAANAPEGVGSLDLSYCHIGPTGIAALVEQLELLNGPLPNAVLLRLRARTTFNPVGPDGADSLRKLLMKLPSLGELRLYGNSLQTEKFKLLSPVIAEMRKIHTLILSRNSLNHEAGKFVSDILSNLSCLHTFYISYNPIGDAGLGGMLPGLKKCKALKILGLRGTSLKDEAGRYLSEALMNLPNLEWLELYQNHLQDGGVIKMLPGLWENKSLRMISLVDNGVSDNGAYALVGYLATTNTLQTIRLYYNADMSQNAMIALRKAVVGRSKDMNELQMAL